MNPEIRESLRSLMKEFQDAASTLVSVTYDSLDEFEKGYYGILYAKPSKRFANALSVSRELLVLVSNFPEQQARIIGALKHYIGKAATGRLEPYVVIIVHVDKRGNAKLKDWGREQGLTIIPVYAGQPLPSGEGLERLLAWELFSHDPFDVTGPVADDSQFYGRRTETQELARQLQFGQIRSCFGVRKVGKTSVLNRVIATAREIHDCYCVMLDCSIDALWALRASELIYALSNAITEASRVPTRYSAVVPVSGSPALHESGLHLIKALSKIDKPLLLFIDEIDYITPASPTAPHWREEFNVFWRALRAVYQESARTSKHLSLLISGVSSKWFAVESIAGVENAALAFVPEEYLSPFARGASMAMIRRLGATAGLKLDEVAADLIAEACSDMPYWIRKACSYIHKHIPPEVRPVSPLPEQVQFLIQAFTESDGGAMAKVAVGHLFRVYPELAPAFLALLADAAAGQQSALHRLAVKYGVVSVRNGRLGLGMMMRAGLSLYQASPPQVAEQEQENRIAAAESTDLGQWAEDLALLNKRRNLLEQKLRNIVVGFIRADSVANPSKGSVAERLLKAVPEARRASLAFLGPEEILSKLFWLELVTLVRKEWSLLGSVFGDADEFRAACAIINDRPDTHAKPFDAAEFALQRRSLKWLEDRLIRL